MIFQNYRVKSYVELFKKKLDLLKVDKKFYSLFILFPGKNKRL